MPIDKFQAKVFKNKDTMSRGQWVENFALSLAGESEDDFANELITEAQVSMYKEKLRKWKSYTKNNLINENAGVVPTEKEIFDRCCEIFGDEFIEACDLVDSNTKKRRKNAAQEDSANGFSEQRTGMNSSKDKESTAGAPTREDGVKPEGVRIAPKAESGTPATISHDASIRNGEDDSKATTSCTVSSKEPVVLNLAYSGEFGNVTLTQEQYNSLLQKFGNKTACDRAIDSLSAKLENGELKARSHYAVLVKWANYRNDKADERNDDGETYLEKNWRKALNNVGMNL